ncbi:hypothetical protein BJY04DRAFT_201010 [Aspergillus karnatakaensis]|uniref:uncharacterized protein n=1 Tax=Aspergillus karnatakaensis TaxID=1810916 RepID=UPI003CCE5046
MAGDNAPPNLSDEGWVHRGSELAITDGKPATNFAIFCTAKFADVRDYRDLFLQSFWSVLDKDLNGTCHCQYDYTHDRVTPKVSWSCFKLKRVNSAHDYTWKQPSLHITWDHATGRQVVYIFDFLPLEDQEQDKFLKILPPAEARKHNPFAWHAAFSAVILEQYDEAFWAVRDLVRDHEKNRRFNINNKSFFTELHDIARHAFHYSEIIGVAEHTLSRLIQEQVRWREEDGTAIRDKSGIAHWLNSHQELLLQQKNAVALKAKSESLNQRLSNEINLGFNLVLQSDSAMMKTIAFVSMVYLPGTFVSGVFGTNFFDFDSPTPGEWAHSRFWLYWAVAVPLTLATMGTWAAWHKRNLIQERFDSSYASMQRKFSSRGVGKGVMSDRDLEEQRNLGIVMTPRGLVRAATTMMRRNVRREDTV